MKIKTILFLLTFCTAIFSCKKDKEIVDPIFEFVAFADESPVKVNELDNSTVGYPLVAKLWAFKPYSENVTLNLQITGHNTAEGVDFTVTPSNAITIPAGKLTSDTIWVKTIDNAAGAASPRTFDVTITSASKGDIKIGLGITNPKQNTVTFEIADDECSLTPVIYNATMVNDIGIDGVTQPTPNAAVGVVTGGTTVALTGDLIWYGPVDNPLVLTLVPDSPGSTKGTVTFGDVEMGTAQDGYEYRFVQIGDGTFNVCSGTIDIEYETYYRVVGDTPWDYWRVISNHIQVP